MKRILAVLALCLLLVGVASAAVGDTILFEQVNISSNITQVWNNGTFQVFPVVQGVSSTDNVDQSFQSTVNGEVPLGLPGATWYQGGQSFQVTKSQVTGFVISKLSNSGSPTGGMIFSIRTDNADKPSSTVLASYKISDSEWSSYATGQEVVINTTAILTPGVTYWFAYQNATLMTSGNYYRFGLNTSGGYASGHRCISNDNLGTCGATSDDIWFKELYARNTENTTITVNGNTTMLDTADAFGMLSGLILNTFSKTLEYNNGFNATSSGKFSDVYLASPGGYTSDPIVINGWGWTNTAESIQSASDTTARNVTFKINTILPVTGLNITVTGFNNNVNTGLVELSGDGATYTTVWDLPASASAQTSTVSTGHVNGNTSVYLRLSKDTTNGYIRWDDLKVVALVDTASIETPSLVYQSGTNTVNLTSDGRAVSSSLDPSLMANVSLIEGAPATSISADFTASNTSGIQPLLVQFTDTSMTTDATIDSWAWDFGDGNTSVLQNPSHTYEVPGTHTANLTITNTSYSLVSTKLSNITVYNRPPIAGFTASNLSGTPPLLVQFTDTSAGVITNRYWDFGEGNTSALQNPEHTFESVGEYQVNLTVTNDGGSSTKLQNITVAYFGAYFIANKTSGSIPLTIQFTDTSIGSYDSWNWSVDDGTLHWYNKTVYADRNLEYTFNNVGSWRVNLSVQNISESGPIYSTTMNITATNIPPVAAFNGYPSAGTTSTAFIFNSTSTGVITSYNWNFGDGNYSATQNTTHMFPSNGIYNVNLTVSNDGGSSYIVHPFTVSAFSVSTSISPTSGVIPLLVTFDETYSGLIPDSYYWEFGDGATSTDKNTTHTYTTIGTFNVNHRIMNGSIISWANTTSAVTALGGSVTANFTANVTAGDYPLYVQFTDTSTYINATPSSWYWTFGDGLTSTSQNPSHTYSNAGTYSVNFTTTTDYGESSKLRSAYISVGGVAANGRQDIILTNTNNIVTLYIKDSNSGNLITHAAVSDEMGNELTSYGNGIFSGSYSTGQHTFTANATDYYTNRATYLISGDLIQTIYLTQVATSVSTTWYTPKTIVISFVDAYGNQVRGASVNARFNETTLPNGVSDLISNYGMNVNIANEALNGTLLMSGSTDYQGSIVFTMLSALKYDIAITYNGETNYYSVYPQDSQYQFRFLTTVATDNIWDDLYANGNTKVWATEPDPSNVTFWWSFQDMTSLTTRVDFYLKDVDLDTMVYITNVTSPVAGNIYQLNYTVPNVRGKNYLVWGNYTRDV